MKTIFWATCPQCTKAFICDGELRHADLQLICPYCKNRFLPDEALEIDERRPH
jgi:uncharacterized Zn-finger protein